MSDTPNTPSALDDLTAEIPNPPQWLVDAMSVPREQGSVTAEDGCKLNYFRWGDPKKPGLLMMHGFLAHSRCFAFIAPYLAKDYHVVAFDLAGMGESGVRHIYSMETRAADALTVAEGTGLFDLGDHGKKPTLIAHSFGAGIGLITMNMAHDKFDGIVICDLMTLRPERLEKHFARRGGPPGSQDPERSNKVYPDYETAKGRFVLAPPQPVGEPVLFDYMAYHSLKQVEGGWTWKFDPSVFRREETQDDHRNHLAKQGQAIVDAPGRKALIYGERSLLFDDDSAAYVRELGGTDIPMIGIPHAGHHLMLDQPMAFLTALRTVLGLWA